MRVALISFAAQQSPFYLEEVGLASVAAFTRAGGHQVLLLSQSDSNVDWDRITAFRPAIVGATVYGPTKEAFYRLCEKVRELLPECRTCAGGYLPTYGAAEMFSETPHLDFAVRREGEVTFRELVALLESRDGRPAEDEIAAVRGLVFRSGDRIVETPDRPFIQDLDALPFPDRQVLEEHGLPLAQVSTSRGCRVNCTFCVSRSFWQGWRGRSPGNVVAELQQLYDRGIRHFNFTDSSFEDPDKTCERMLAIAQAIVDSGMRISYVADARAELHRKLSVGQINLLRRSGLRSLFVGIEAANPEDLRLYGKPARLQDVYRCLELFPALGIRIRPGFMNFNPYSTPDRLRQNLQFLARFGLASNFFWLVSRYALESGGRLYRQIEADGLLMAGAWDEPYRYRFVDERLEPLHAYLVDAAQALDQELGIPSWVQYCHDALLEILHDVRQNLADGGDPHDLALVSAIEEDHLCLLSDLNATNAAMVADLIDLAETGWDAERAERVVAEHLDGESLARRIHELGCASGERLAYSTIDHPLLNAVVTQLALSEVT